jgi:NAD(P)-dependent dehydrogenase (short-subunit alcohol dehydrogenase family)
MRAVVTGANRGIGLELVRQLSARGDRVEACARDPSAARELRDLAGERVQLHRLDVTEPSSVRALAEALGDAAVDVSSEGPTLDVLFNVAGVWGGDRQSLAAMSSEPSPDLALEDVGRTFDVNAVGPLRMVLALLPHVRRGQGRKLVHVTSGMGSIGDNTRGGSYAYRMSKAALNMMSRSLAVDLRDEGIVSVVINPGWVRTDMGGPSAPTAVADSVRGILREIDRVTLSDSGEFLNWKGNRYPW